MVHNTLSFLRISFIPMGCSVRKGNPFIILFFSLLLLHNSSYSQNNFFKKISIDSIIRSPSAILVSADNHIYLLSSQENTLIKLDNSGTLLKKIGGKGWGNLNFDYPSSFHSQDGLDIFVADCYNKRIQRFNRNLEYLSSLSFDNYENNFKYPYLVGVDKFSNLFVFDTENMRFYKYSKETKLEKTFGELEFSESKTAYPKKLAFDSKNNLYVMKDNCIYVYSNWGFLLKEITIEENISAFSVYNDRVFVLVNNELREYNKMNELIKYNLEKVNPDTKNIKDISINNTNIYILTDEAILLLSTNQLLNWKRN